MNSFRSVREILDDMQKGFRLLQQGYEKISVIGLELLELPETQAFLEKERKEKGAGFCGLAFQVPLAKLYAEDSKAVADLLSDPKLTTVVLFQEEVSKFEVERAKRKREETQ